MLSIDPITMDYILFSDLIRNKTVVYYNIICCGLKCYYSLRVLAHVLTSK